METSLKNARNARNAMEGDRIEERNREWGYHMFLTAEVK